MISLSNSDAEKVCNYLNEHAQILSSRIKSQSSTKEFNNLRLLQLLLKKITNKVKAINPQ